MNVSWSSRIAVPTSRQTCGHRRCTRYTRASTAALCGAVVIEFGAALLFPDASTQVVIAAFTIAAAGIALSLWPHPRSDDLEALIEATREMTPRPRLDWTDGEWAAREKELSDL